MTIGGLEMTIGGNENKYLFIWYFGEIGVTLQPECRNCLSEASK
jgi:hypothetical protein